MYIFFTAQYFDDHQAYTEHVKQQGDDRGFLKLFQRKYAFSLTVILLLLLLIVVVLLLLLDLITRLVYTDWSCSYSFASTWRS